MTQTLSGSVGWSTALDRAGAGDEAAFADLVREHQSMVYSLALRFLRDPAEAEELAQEVFLQLFRSLGRIESPAHLVHWLRRVTSNRCIDAVRRRREAVVPLEEMAAPEGPGSDPLAAPRLRALVAELPAGQRTVVLLRFQEEMQLSEIARTAGMPLNTVKSHLRRAMDSLRKGLGATR